MKEEYNKITLVGLEDELVKKIHHLEKRKMFKRQSLYGLLAVLSLGGLIPTAIYVYNVVAVSGVFDYVSLLFSNTETIVYWKELLLSVSESLPFMGIALFLGAVAIFIWSIVKVKREQLYKVVLV